MVGNGLSTSPSTVAPHHRAAFPLVTVGDNVRLQARGRSGSVCVWA
jgi:homoserine acetyltransferase